VGRCREKVRRSLLAALTLACLASVAAAQSASAAAGGIKLRNASAQLVERGDRAPQRRQGGPAPAARPAIPLLSPHPARLRQAKARAARRSPVAAALSPQAAAPLSRAPLFNGLNKPGMSAAESEGVTTPPDTTGAIGPSNYVEFVNGTGITAYDRNLNPVSGPVALEDFINFPSDDVFDPQIQWDQQWGRWIYAMDDIEFFENEFEEEEEANYLAFGWSKGADPSNLSTEFPGEEAGAGWCEYFIPTGEEFDDYPKLGHSDSGLTIGTNVFTTGFLGSRLWSIPKLANPQTCPELPLELIGVTGFLETEDGDEASTPVPANTADSSADSYVVAADDPLTSGDAQIMGWHISGAGPGATLFADGNMSVSPFEVPASVPQPGTGEVIDSLDARLTNAVAVADPEAGQEGVWTQHTIDGPGGRSVVRWYELLPATQTVRQEGTISDPSHFVFNGSISPTRRGDAAAVDFNRGSATLSPDMHAQSRYSSTPPDELEGDILLGESAGPAEDFSCDIGEGESCRWGDYAGASPDPSRGAVVWGSNQGLAAPSGEDARWTTRNFALIADPTISSLTPPAPTIAATDPPSPGNDTSPKVKGSAEAGTTVRIYKSADCSGPVAAEGSAAAFESPGIGVSVAAGAATQLTATATNSADNTSPCSAPFAYVESSAEGGGAGAGTGAGGGQGGTGGADNGEAPIAQAAGIALVKGGKALLRLTCHGAAACRGSLRLVARVKVGKGKKARSSKRRVRNLVIGRARFSLLAGKTKVVRVNLTRKGKALVRRAGRRGLPVKLRGSGVKNRTVKLKSKSRRGGKGNRNGK
jgi:hypothetical protein